jgi:hypothetical protein
MRTPEMQQYACCTVVKWLNQLLLETHLQNNSLGLRMLCLKLLPNSTPKIIML